MVKKLLSLKNLRKDYVFKHYPHFGKKTLHSKTCKEMGW